MAENVSIWCLSWNTQSNVRFAESLNPEIVEEHRSGGYFSTAWRYPGEILDFWPEISAKITQNQPTIVAISFQEDLLPGSYAHSHLFPEQMDLLGYQLFNRANLLGLGKTCFNSVFYGDLFFRGLRCSIYLRKDYLTHITEKFQPERFVTTYSQNKGATAIYLTLPNQETIAIVNSHFPFNATSLKESVQKRDKMIRQDALNEQNSFFNSAYRKLISESPAQPKYVVWMGDLNYRMLPFEKWSARQSAVQILASAEILKFDELRQQMQKGTIYQYEEGINNAGPEFAPTCKMSHDRSPGQIDFEAYKYGVLDQRVPSYCDRILYQTSENSTNRLICTEYDRLDLGLMVKSDHAAVIATLILGLF